MPVPPASSFATRVSAREDGLHTQALGWFIPHQDRDQLDFLRAQLLVLLSFLVALNTGFFAVLHAVHHQPGNGYTVIGLLAGLSAAGVGFPFLLKWGVGVRPLSGAFLGVLQVGLISVASFDDGLNSGSVYWLAALPLGAAFLGGTRLGWASAVLSMLAVTAMFTALKLGFTFPISVPPSQVPVHQTINLFSCIACVGALAWMYEGPLVNHLRALTGRLETVNQDLRRELDERQRAQTHAESASRAKDVLLANMSHEFRTPLTAILGFTEILVDEANPDQRPLLESIDRGGRRLLNTLNGVLDLAWIEGSQTDIELTTVNAQTIVGDIASHFLPAAVQRGLSFEVSGEDILVRADLEALRRVVAAIIDNAIRFTEFGAVSVSVQLDGDDALIRVSDTGIGMVPEFVEHASEPFRQASEGDARTHEGVGVGLTVAERLLEMMGGKLAIKSHPGRGTTVSLRLAAILHGEDAAVEHESEWAPA